jgi:hypothetical protein
LKFFKNGALKSKTHNPSLVLDGKDHAATQLFVRGPERRFYFEIEARYGSFSWS